ncbi:zinc finger family protein [Hibiscus syriacus]|uniref:Zinc finger family protein n=1 Tax=Hibiscus syriacus TaxID=106335 RepID=A0A6A2Y5W1_HIBSY|nr:protein BIG GRAIN 1-like B [Hibiscus syriacus]KAE8664344.1 zinc finger family protein [Hibiscus syriacus]
MHRRECSTIDTTVPRRRRNPSFSSTLFDAIYRSVDDSGNGNEPTLRRYVEKTGANPVKKQGGGSMEKASSLKRAIMIEKWIEKQGNYGSAVHSNSASSSSGSSNGGIFSSSEVESRRSKTDKNNKQEGGGGFTKTKLKALKIYGELKKVKQPISPGGRITNFLNSIFNANAKKVKMCSDGVSGDVSFRRKSKSTASSRASFSRSCLSKTPCSRGNNKYSDGNKRSVKFCPVSVIVDEDCRPCGHKRIYEEDPRLIPTSTVQKNLKFSSRNLELKKKESAVDSKASDCLRSYQRRGIGKLNLTGFIEHYDDEDEDDDALSCSSSDLFELDHLIGIGRYREELPVYETTRFKNNEAFVNGFMF